MVKHLNVIKYRKLIDFQIEFTEKINLISGSNGTCKSSILYLVSNSYKRMVQANMNSDLKQCLSTIQSLNNKFNPKIENLTKGDKIHNDPAKDVKGNIVIAKYFDDSTLNFRKHESGQSKDYRYSIKPKYTNGKNERLPELPVIYLGLSRLISFGEVSSDYQNDIPKKLKETLNEEQKKIFTDFSDAQKEDSFYKSIKKNLPEKYLIILNKLYTSFTNVEIKDSDKFTSIVGSEKIRPDFTTEIEGIDSNTISAGEDNLYIILTAMVSLRYYYDTKATTEEDIKSILLIDELDATLHPSYQEKLFKLLIEYSTDYKIQVIATTHSIDLLEVAFLQKQNVIYISDLINKVEKLNGPNGGPLDINVIKNFLKSKKNEDDFTKKIAVFSEDEEARLLINYTLDYIKSVSAEGDKFAQAESFLHMVEMNIGSDNLKNMFSDSYLIGNLMNAFCILDGDQDSDWGKKIITLPGKSNPEKLLFDYLDELISEPDYNNFWLNSNIIQESIDKNYVIENVIKVRDEIERSIKELKSSGKSSGVRREKYKKLFKSNRSLLLEVYKFWLVDPKNQKEIDEFVKEFSTMFNSVRKFSGISKDLVLPGKLEIK